MELIVSVDRKATTAIVKCSCEHSYQDEKYGRGNRVANLRCGEKAKNEGICTVCGKAVTIGK